MSERKNGEYTIIQSIMIGGAEFVMGHNPKACTPYVTWECKDGNNYFWGHYIMDRHNAERDLLERATLELDRQDQIRERVQKQKKGGHER